MKRTDRTACPSWCTGHTTGRDAITGAASTLHTGPAVTVAARTADGDPSEITVTPRLIVTEASAALDRHTWTEIRVTRPDGRVDTVIPERAAIEAGTYGTDEAAAVLERAAALLTGPDEPVHATVPGTWPNGEPRAVRDAEDVKGVSEAYTPDAEDDLDRAWEYLKADLIARFGAARGAQIIGVLFEFIKATGGVPQDDVTRVGLELLDTGRFEVVTEYLAARK